MTDKTLEVCADCGADIEGEVYEDGTDTLDQSCFDDRHTSCNDCGDSVHQDDAVDVGNMKVCDSCSEDYYTCEDCSNMVHVDHMTTVEYDELVCDDCYQDHYHYCDECDESYHQDSDAHDHGCDCLPPTLEVAIPNGRDFLRADTATTLSIPAGLISDEGIGQVANEIRRNIVPVAYDLLKSDPNEYDRIATANQKWHTLSYRVGEVGEEWQRKDGNFTKRLSRFAYKEFGLKIPSEMLSKIGNIARAQSDGAEVEVEITRDLNLPAEDFAHEDSCWWQSYYASRCTLKSNGGFGLRSFEMVEFPKYAYVTGPWAGSFGPRWTQVGTATARTVSGRAWVLPLKKDDDGELEPTFSAETADAYVVFNGYGDLSGYIPARLMAQMTGKSYKKIDFSGGEMYVNAGGYLIADEDILAEVEQLNFDLDDHANLYRTESKELSHA